MRETALYLDTARMGMISPVAERAGQAFLSLAGREGCSPCFEAFLHEGTAAWPLSLRERYPGLADWRGLASFKGMVRTFAEIVNPCEVLLANRTAHLMRLAARLLFHSRKRVLTTDLEWPGYRSILELERERIGGKIHEVALRTALLSERCTPEDLVRLILTAYDTHRCESLFLSAVSFQGLRLPVREIASALSDSPRQPFVVVDGAQALGHAPPDSPFDHCDLYIAGSHKWLRASYPMGLAFCPRWGSQDVIRLACADMLKLGELDDPLLRFTREMETGTQEVFGETVSLASLFPTAAVMHEALGEEGGAQGRFEKLLSRARLLEEAAAGTSWRPVTPADAFRSGILLLQSDDPALRSACGEEVRRRFQQQGIALTAYGAGLVRLSAPPHETDSEDISQLRSALLNCA